MEKSFIAAKDAPAALGPYSQAIWAGNLLFVSGQVPIDPATGSIVSDEVTEQAHQSLRNVRAILETAGLTLDHVVKATIFIRDMGAFAAINEVYATYFSKPYPARSCVEVSRLPRDVQVEIEVIASRG